MWRLRRRSKGRSSLPSFCHSDRSGGISHYFLRFLATLANSERCLDLARHDRRICRGKSCPERSRTGCQLPEEAAPSPTNEEGLLVVEAVVPTACLTRQVLAASTSTTLRITQESLSIRSCSSTARSGATFSFAHARLRRFANVWGCLARALHCLPSFSRAPAR
jgi:hypothetical protein